VNYWRWRLDSVISEYRSWSLSVSQKLGTSLTTVSKARRCRERCESATVDSSQQPLSSAVVDELMTTDDYHMMDMSDTLFSSLSMPTLNTPRDFCMSALYFSDELPATVDVAVILSFLCLGTSSRCGRRHCIYDLSVHLCVCV